MFLSLFFSSAVSDDTYPKINGSCVMKDGLPTFNADILENADAWVYWEDALNFTGWYQLHVKGNPKSSDEDIMTCAGFLEGYVSHDRIYNHFNLIFDIQEWERPTTEKPQRRYPQVIKNYLSANLNYIRESIDAYSATSKYWQEMGLIMKQFDGLVAGYLAKDKISGTKDATMDEFDLWFQQSEGDMFDISEMFPDAVQSKQKQGIGPGAHCSGLVRLLPDYSDIYFSHDAWSDFRELHGQLKEYDLPIRKFKAHKITMSTRVGKLSSYDDFYINDQGLFVLETTLGNFNEELYEHNTPAAPFTWIRAIHATWTSDSGKEWTETFGKHNSGTYNNQYLVIDSKKLKRNVKPEKDLFWVIEQIPTTFESADLTDVLVRDGYFPSINTPYFDRLFKLAHYPEQIASWGEDGNYWDLKTSSRYLLMQREAPHIMNFDQFKDFMRYNRYQVDPYSNGDPGQGILARYDQRPGFNPHFKKRMFGGLDTKALKLTEATAAMKFHALASPEYVHNPVFNFADWPEYNHDGLPEVWKHNWTEFMSLSGDKCTVHNGNKGKCQAEEGCGFCIASQECYSGDKNAPYVMTCEAGWEIAQPLQSWAKPTIIVVTLAVICFVVFIYVAHFVNKKKSLL